MSWQSNLLSYGATFIAKSKYITKNVIRSALFLVVG